jgi:hypothetical protein
MSKALLPVAALSGFLGPSNTTRLNQVLRHGEGRRVTVVEPGGQWWAALPKSRRLQDAALRREIDARWKERLDDCHQANVFVADERLDKAAVRKAIGRRHLTFNEGRKGMPARRALRDLFLGWQRTQAEANA